MKDRNGKQLTKEDLKLSNQENAIIVQQEPGNTTTARDTSAIAGQSSVIQSNYSRAQKGDTFKHLNSDQLSILKEGDMPRTSSDRKKVS